jgi:hypothetical protein
MTEDDAMFCPSQVVSSAQFSDCAVEAILYRVLGAPDRFTDLPQLQALIAPQFENNALLC